ncbi:long-chain acyl-CoA synthetase [Parabacteroides sp. PF5-5]|uniref:AMP-dependent synthetase/ligase n=1 Tax=unclassified Parabacteroides TaxID=2649774 RepID=UPI002474483F|nr:MULTISPECIES: long-chain fatty acid--CoA ligase [unclassified Parabacteroides]MDH6305769.1 long-chain acyl-CoA synthetase [Parabacteroides sp. PH5-39]MDH6316841.1 long-chain acyl-CoA synthetase [Parabacteroides sp. PF5-13]MDH6320482.1 long-chain acyl-CoA synthetase [Parabacteroides sp. PH5-13]MDH6324212.1 long-chain acyl-CoA synthetase [Parabacteroides sp. PH5-8]MDH6328027.1 long-chain acyl-CoA synthetase [Parabacteroides sp. PH5-41]
MINYHYAELIHRQAEKYGTRTALKYRDDESGKWLKISWRSFSETIMLTAKAMAEFGIEKRENIGIYSQNMPQCLFTDFAAYANRAVMVPMYPTSSPAQIEYIINDASIHTLFVGEQLQYNNAYKVLKDSSELKRLIIFDKKVIINPEDKASIYFDDFLSLGETADAETTVKIRMNAASPKDLATIIYTSGTTGEPKGVMLHHSNFLEAMRIHDIRLPIITDKETSICFLPLTHIFEKAWTYLCLHKGVKVAINKDPKMIQQTLPEVCPSMMCNVPRFWEKVYAGVHEKIESFPGFLQKLTQRAIRVGHRHNLEYKNKGIKPPLGLRLQFFFYDKTIFMLLKKVLGIQKGRLFPTAGAPLSDEVNVFLQSVNIPIVYGYGLSETTATVSFCPTEGFVIGSIGNLMPDVQVRIDESNNEILVKGATITTGYYKKPEENAKAFTEDGFFRTGDAGKLEGEVLYFTERIKDLYKTSNGKYIAPQAIEMLMGNDKYIAQIAVIGDKRKFVGALIVPDFDALEAYANRKGISFGSREEMVSDTKIQKLIEAHVEEHQKDLASYEKIKRFVLLAEPFTMEGRELTDTLKLRRPVILEKYAEQIEEMYKE